MSKIIDSFKGLNLFFSNVSVFNPDTKFKNKRVAIIGPADSAYEKQDGAYLDTFDYVIRINKALNSWDVSKEDFIGKKTDILFHSFFENEKTGGGEINIDLIKQFHVSYLLNPRTDFEAYRRTFNFFRKYSKSLKVYHYPKKLYKGMCVDFPEGLRPTIGFTALYGALFAECQELYITGFTFFKTPYAKGYRDNLIDLEKNRKHVKTHGIHDADLEYELFKKHLSKTNCKEIKLDNKLRLILNNDE